MDEAAVERRKWTEEETVLALYLYFQLPFGKLHSGNPEIKQLADAMERSPNSVAMKLCNFASLDPKITTSGRKGLTGASKLDRDTYARFGQNWSGLVGLAEEKWAEQVERAVETPAPKALNEQRAEFRFEPYAGASSTDRTVPVRLGQSFFRRAVLANFEEACCITGIAEPRLLVASHIKPWGVDTENRHNPANGFLLSATFDKAFDRGLITIGTDHRVRVARQLREHASDRTRDHFSHFDGSEIRRGVRFDANPEFLEWHNKRCFVDAL